MNLPLARFLISVLLAWAALAAHAAPIDDARAAVFEGWRVYRPVFWSLQMALSCDVAEAWAVNAAALRVQVQMQHEQDRAGLVADEATTIAIGTFTEKSLAIGRADAARGICQRLTPGERGRMRLLVGDLMRR